VSENVIAHPAIARPACDPATRVTKSLLGYGVLAGPFYVLVAGGQALLRPGFSLVHDDTSLLSNGSFGWVQILNFVLTGSMDGFPAGAPKGRPTVASVHGVLHIAAGGAAFLALIAACFVIAASFSSTGQRRWAAASRMTGILFLAGFLGLASGSSSPSVVIGFWAALLVVWAWIASLAVNLYRRAAASARPA
jgi:Protein of unknown function (DUF998)